MVLSPTTRPMVAQEGHAGWPIARCLPTAQQSMLIPPALAENVFDDVRGSPQDDRDDGRDPEQRTGEPVRLRVLAATRVTLDHFGLAVGEPEAGAEQRERRRRQAGAVH